MIINNIKEIYKEIFKSYDKPLLEKHIKKIIELDEYIPYSSTFYCVTNTQDLTFEFVSKNIYSCLGINPDAFKNEGMRFFWSRIHPEDIEQWLSALNALMDFTLKEIPAEQRSKMNFTWNYRFKNANNEYVNIIQNTTPLQFDKEEKPIIGLAHYTVVDARVKMQVTASAKLLNEHNEYETKYFNNFSQKLLSNSISNRERDVIHLLVLNYSSKDIAEKLNISSNTVDTHRRNILKKLKISSTGELIGMLKMDRNIL